VGVRYKPGGLLTEQTGGIPDTATGRWFGPRRGRMQSAWNHCAPGGRNDLQIAGDLFSALYARFSVTR
jgi:hypothetical protein